MSDPVPCKDCISFAMCNSRYCHTIRAHHSLMHFIVHAKCNLLTRYLTLENNLYAAGRVQEVKKFYESVHT